MSKRVAAAAILGACAVALGAFGTHALKGYEASAEVSANLVKQGLSANYITETWKTAVFYHIIHAVALLGLALYDKNEQYRLTRELWWAGVVIFSGTLYLLCLSQIRWLGAITPLGGALLISGWLSLAAKAYAGTKGSSKELL